MPIYDLEYTCPNGHSFRANAKLRSRCPECGVMARRGSASSRKPAETPPVEPKVEIQEPKTSVEKVVAKTIRVVRQGRERMPAAKKPAPKPTPKRTAKTPIKAVGVKNSINRTQSGLVKKQRMPRGTTPVVKGLPKKIAQSRSTMQKRPFWHQVAEWVGFGK